LLRQATAMGRQVIDRCNLTVLSEPGQEDLVPFLAQHGVRVVASLPCYSLDNVDKQRGRGVFDKSIDALVRLNEAVRDPDIAYTPALRCCHSLPPSVADPHRIH